MRRPVVVKGVQQTGQVRVSAGMGGGSVAEVAGVGLVGRQVTFLPVETLLCLAASFVVNHRHFGGSTAHRAPEPVPSLARLFARPPSSVLAKMANLDGSRSHGGRWDVLAGAMLREDPARFSATYRILLHAARAEGIGLPGCLIS